MLIKKQKKTTDQLLKYSVYFLEILIVAVTKSIITITSRSLDIIFKK